MHACKPAWAVCLEGRGMPACCHVPRHFCSSHLAAAWAERKRAMLPLPASLSCVPSLPGFSLLSEAGRLEKDLEEPASLGNFSWQWNGGLHLLLPACPPCLLAGRQAETACLPATCRQLPVS